MSSSRNESKNLNEAAVENLPKNLQEIIPKVFFEKGYIGEIKLAFPEKVDLIIRDIKNGAMVNTLCKTFNINQNGVGIHAFLVDFKKGYAMRASNEVHIDIAALSKELDGLSPEDKKARSESFSKNFIDCTFDHCNKLFKKISEGISKIPALDSDSALVKEKSALGYLINNKLTTVDDAFERTEKIDNLVKAFLDFLNPPSAAPDTSIKPK